MLPAKQILKSPPPSEDVGFGNVVASAPKLSLTLIGAGVGALWGGLAGATLGSLKIGAGIGASLFGLRGYAHGKDLESWLNQLGP